MKKLWMTALLVSTLQYSDAQVEKGRVGIGGMFNVYFTSSKQATTSSNTITGGNNDNTFVDFTGSPGVLLFIKNGLALNSGVSIGYSNRKWNDDRYDALSGGNGNYDNSKINSYGIQIGLAKYNRLFDNFYFTISGNLGYVYELVNSEFGYSSASIIGSNLSENYGRSNMNNLNLFITPGFSYFLSRKIAINATFGDIGGRYGWGNGNTENYFTNVYNGVTTVTNSDQNRDVSEFNFRFRLASSIGLGVQYFIK
jgi:hypothetical protein